MKQLKKYWFSGFVYVSVIFLLIALYWADYLSIPEIHSIKYLFGSIIVLCAGFIFTSLAWKQILTGANYPISISHSISSTGLAVFGKYIPGKLWAMVGQGGYILKKYNYPKAGLTTIIITAQIISIWIGLILSVIGLVFFGSFDDSLSWGIVVTLILFSGIIFTNFPAKAANKLLAIFSKESFVHVNLNLRTLFITSIMYLLMWVLRCVGFYLLVVSLSNGTEIHIGIGLSYALALCVGFLALAVPGGLGVREGILVAYLTYAGFDLQQATTISIASRLWFLIGECFIFFTGFILDKLRS